jgi:hypothetical protein
MPIRQHSKPLNQINKLYSEGGLFVVLPIFRAYSTSVAQNIVITSFSAAPASPSFDANIDTGSMVQYTGSNAVGGLDALPAAFRPNSFVRGPTRLCCPLAIGFFAPFGRRTPM